MLKTLLRCVHCANQNQNQPFTILKMKRKRKPIFTHSKEIPKLDHAAPNCTCSLFLLEQIIIFQTCLSFLYIFGHPLIQTLIYASEVTHSCHEFYAFALQIYTTKPNDLTSYSLGLISIGPCSSLWFYKIIWPKTYGFQYGRLQFIFHSYNFVNVQFCF